MLSSLTMACAEETSVSAGRALAVDREKFSDLVTQHIKATPISPSMGEVTAIPEGRRSSPPAP